MNKTDLKNFAIAARLELLQRVMNRANLYGVNEETCKSRSFAPSSGFQKLGGELLTSEEETQRDALIRRVNLQGYRQTMEEAAYTWFNRLIALRYMQEHQLLPVSQRVLPEMPGQMPEIIREAHQLSLDGVDSALVLDLLDRNDNTTLYRYLLISLCNALHDPLPQMFEKISDYTELLFPDGLLKDDSVLAALAKIPADDFQDIQVIGWLYQYYNTELKNETFELLKKNVKITKERIGAATQLFTPEWIVRYMVQNSLGRLWLEGHPEESLRMKWRYYMDEAQQEPEVAAKLAEIRQGYASMQLEDIKLLDPCMGSGHILVYAFDMLMEIYRTMGYTDRDAVRSIVENNLYGLDIDDRAAQLAYFAVMMKACEYDRRFLRRGIQPHVCAMQESIDLPEEVWPLFGMQKNTAKTLYGAFTHAKDFGSLIAPKVTLDDLDQIEARMDKMDRMADYGDLATQALTATAISVVQPLMEQARILVQKYDVVVTNPPYMGGSGMNDRLSKFVKDNYPDSKSDLFAVFIERCGEMLNEKGYQAMITQHAWMFLSSYEKLRGTLQQRELINMAHLGPRAFEEIGGEVVQTTAFVMQSKHTKGYKGSYARLIEPTTQDGKEEMFLAETNRYTAQQENFTKIPGMPVAYNFPEIVFDIFHRYSSLSDVAITRLGMTTANNNLFVRMWYEVATNRMILDAANGNDVLVNKYKWVPYNKGGSFRKWYGNNECLLNWENDGYAIKHYGEEEGHIRSTVPNTEYYFLPCTTWSKISSGNIAFRFRRQGSIFDVAGACLFARSTQEQMVLTGFMNSNIVQYLLTVLSPTLNYEGGHISAIPVADFDNHTDVLKQTVEENIKLSATDWDSFENSWDFKKHPLI